MRRRTYLRCCGAASLAATAGCAEFEDALYSGRDDFSVADTTEVTMETGQWRPFHLRVSVGDTVTWTNKAVQEHRVFSDTDNWDMAAVVKPDEKVEHTFNKPGIYDAVCDWHYGGEKCRIGVDTEITSPIVLGANTETPTDTE